MTPTPAALFGADGLITIGPRPGKKSLKALQSLAPTHCVTLLSAREDAPAIGRLCPKIGCAWVWTPITGGGLDHLAQYNLTEWLDMIRKAVADESAPHLYLHCSAGIHRTGFFAWCLLRANGQSPEQARSTLAAMRSVTCDQVGEDRLELAETMLREQRILQ